jgi:hypothetical protein
MTDYEDEEASAAQAAGDPYSREGLLAFAKRQRELRPSPVEYPYWEPDWNVHWLHCLIVAIIVLFLIGLFVTAVANRDT